MPIVVNNARLLILPWVQAHPQHARMFGNETSWRRSGDAHARGLSAWETDPARLAALVDDRLRATHDEPAQALDGLMASHQQFLRASQVQHLTALDQQIAILDTEVTRRLGLLGDSGHPCVD